MRLACSLLLSTLLTFSGFPAFAQAPQENKDQQPPPKTEPVSLKQPLAFGLEDGTPIKLRLTRNLSSADATTGDRVDFEVLEDIKVKDVIVVPRGGLALATVTEAQHKRRMARGGKLDVNIDDVRLIDGEKAPLRAVKEVKGGGHTGAMTGAMIGTAIVFFPAAPLFLFMHGKDITIPKGTEVTAYINGDIPLDPVRFQPKEVKPAADPTTAQPSAAPAISANGVDSTLSSVDVKSTPDGADITVDDKYMAARLRHSNSRLATTRSNWKSLVSKFGRGRWRWALVETRTSMQRWTGIRKHWRTDSCATSYFRSSWLKLCCPSFSSIKFRSIFFRLRALAVILVTPARTASTVGTARKKAGNAAFVSRHDYRLYALGLIQSNKEDSCLNRCGLLNSGRPFACHNS